MCRLQYVLALVTWFLGVAHPWDFAVSAGDQLIFYTNDGNKTDTVHFQSRNLAGLAYDEVHNVMLYVDKQDNNDAICGYYISTKENKCFVERNGRNIHSIAYDPATETIFFTDINEKSINWVSLKRGYYNNIYGNLLFKMQDRTPTDITVDSCRGYIYWSNRDKEFEDMERARFDGSGRETVLDCFEYLDTFSLAVDPQTQRIYYFTTSGYIDNVHLCIAHLNGIYTSTVEILEKTHFEVKELTVSKDYIYWMNSDNSYKSVWRYPKNGFALTSDLKEIAKFDSYHTLGIVTKYNIADQIKGIDDCDSLASLIPTLTVVCKNYCLEGNCSVNDERLPECSCNAGYSGKRCEIDACHGYCMHGNCKLGYDGHPTCSCNAGYSGNTCEIDACHGYCLHGNCSHGDDGHPKCSCNAGYSGKTCEIDACHGYCMYGDCSLVDDGHPSCSCNAGYSGKTCEIDACHGYCMYGDCSLGDDGHPSCSCNAGYSGKRCEIDACHGYCMHGNCMLGYDGHPTCSCDAGYSGKTCGIDACHGYCMYGDCSLGDDGHPSCSCNAGYTGLRCEVFTCHGYCLNNGDCSLNENSEPICHCEGDYSGDRCEVSHCLNYCLQGNCSLSEDGHPTCSCDAGYSGERCEVIACHGYCLNDGECSLNEEDEPVCQCVDNYEGSRCEADISSTC